MIQLQCLNYILQTKSSSFLTVNNLSSEYFSDYPKEYAYIQQHIATYGNVPDLETFLSNFPHFEVIQVSESESYLLKTLQEDRNTRYLASSFNKVRDLIMSDRTEEAIQVYKNAYEGLETSSSITSVDITKDVSRYDAYIERTRSFEKFYISTGLPELDNIIGGWDRQEELATIVARTNMGKSWMLLNFAKAAVEQGLNVGLYSGEMSERKVGYRFDTLLGHISNGGLIHGNENVQNEYKRYIDSLPTRLKGSLKVLTPNMINGPAGVSALRAFIEKEHLDILFVDQHSLLEDDRKAKNPVEKAANISRDLKNLQVMKKIPIISASQQNRNSTENGIGTEHIAQSDRISQDSTIILALEKKDNIMKVHLIKSRDSENGAVLKYLVDFNRGMFTYVPDGDEPVTTTTPTHIPAPTEGEEVF
jgi:replicative DNA helicase